MQAIGRLLHPQLRPYLRPTPGRIGLDTLHLWPAQIRILDILLTTLFVVVLKARQLGLTWLALAYLLWLWTLPVLVDSEI